MPLIHEHGRYGVEEGEVQEDTGRYPLDWQDRQGHTIPVWHK